MSGKTAGDPRKQLAQAMATRAEQLRITWNEVADRAGMRPQNLLRIRKGQINLSWRAADGIEDALRWSRGSVQAILDGGEATPLPEESPRPPVEVDTDTPRGGKYGELWTADDVGTDEWIEFYAEFPEVVKAGIAVRRKRRELEMAEKLVEKYLAERPVPHEVGDGGR